jgi:hypothetical protein
MVGYDVGEIKIASRGREAELLEYVGHLPRGVLDGKHHPCLPIPARKGTSFPAARWPVSRLRSESIAALGRL